MAAERKPRAPREKKEKCVILTPQQKLENKIGKMVMKEAKKSINKNPYDSVFLSGVRKRKTTAKKTTVRRKRTY